MTPPLVVNTWHHCEHGAKPVPGAIAVVTQALSSCCGAILAEGGTPEAGWTCTACGQGCERVMGEPAASWTCHCGEQMSRAAYGG